MTGYIVSTLPTATGQAGKVLSTDGTVLLWTSAGTINTTQVPNLLGTGNPGTGTNGAMAADATIQMPALSQLTDVNAAGLAAGNALLYDSVSGKFKPGSVGGVVPLYSTIDNGCVTLARGLLGDSGSYGSTPGSGVEHFTSFRADKTITISTIRFQTGSTVSSASTLARVGLYTVVGNTKTLVASCANKTLFGGTGSNTYQTVNCVLSATYQLQMGVVYAVGLIQVATTPASIMGAWFNPAFLGGTPALALTQSGLTDLTASSTTQNAQQFPIYYELVV